MILYDPNMTIEMFRYGIQIPVKDSRARRTFEHLTSHSRLTALQDRWHRSDLTETLMVEDLERAHSPDYVKRLFSSELETELVRTYELIDTQGRYHRYDPDSASRPLKDMREWILAKAAGTYQASRLALETGFCFYFAGGMHHAQYHHGSGFCLINDIVIAIRRLQAEGRVQQTWVIDLDAHKGDGTAALTKDDHSIHTLSIHMANGWPLDQPEVDAQGCPNPSFVPSDIDIPIGEDDNERYNLMLKAGLESLSGLSVPNLAIVVSGSDPYEADELPSTSGLSLSLKQLLDRDQMVYSHLIAAGIPAAYLMAGGYGENSWRVYAQFLEWVLMKRFA